MKYRLIWFSVLLVALVSLGSYAQAPVPLINVPLIPDAAAPGGADFTLTVNGTGFVSGSVVNWNGSARPTTFVNNSKLTAAIPAADIATASTAWVTVVNPAPSGPASNVAFFTITANTGNDSQTSTAQLALGPTIGSAFSKTIGWLTLSRADCGLRRKSCSSSSCDRAEAIFQLPSHNLGSESPGISGVCCVPDLGP